MTGSAGSNGAKLGDLPDDEEWILLISLVCVK